MSNYDSFASARELTTEDLKKVLRRASGDAPVLGPQDLATIRNFVRPALAMPKFGSAGHRYLDESPWLKHAGWLDDVWSGVQSGASTLWSGVKDLGRAGYGLVSAPVKAAPRVWSGLQRGWNQNSGAWAPIMALSEGFTEGTQPFRDASKDLYSGVVKTVGGALGTVPGVALGGQAVMDTGAGDYLRKAYHYGEIGSEWLPDVALSLIPGGQTGTVTRAAATAARNAPWLSMAPVAQTLLSSGGEQPQGVPSEGLVTNPQMYPSAALPPQPNPQQASPGLSPASTPGYIGVPGMMR